MNMPARRLNFADRLLAEVDAAMRVVAATPQARRPAPVTQAQPDMDTRQNKLSAALMRVNHTGEIAAQGLYRGQALAARDPELRAELLQAAAEEHDHLAWCQLRTAELGGRVSVLAPLWYSGSFAIGVLAGMTGDKTSLGFLAETENQVGEHLQSHLQRLPEQDERSRAIVEKMREDEISHEQNALQRGGGELPKPVKQAMRAVAKVMTTVSFRL